MFAGFARDSVCVGICEVLCCGIVREFVPPLALRVRLFGIYACVFVALLFCARDSVLDLDFGDIGFKKESLLVFV